MVQKQTGKGIIREKIIIYLDLSSKVISKKDLIKNLINFAKAKLETNPHHSFNIFFFKEGGEPKIHENLTEIKTLKSVLEEAWDSRTQEGNYFENGLFFCLSGIASSFLEQAITFRILVISDLPSVKNSEYMEALMNLVETVRTFPTFIDIIRIGNQRIYADDVKLRVISTLTNGGLFYIETGKEMQDALEGLIKNKLLPDLRPEGGQAIAPEHSLYYQDLALELEDANPVELLSLKCVFCEEKKCQYCNNIEDYIRQCPSCGTAMHECCASIYSWNYNIGLKNIFRCPGCNTLIKIDERNVYTINGEEMPANLKMTDNNEKAIGETLETWNPADKAKSPPEIQEKGILIEEKMNRCEYL